MNVYGDTVVSATRQIDRPALPAQVSAVTGAPVLAAVRAEALSRLREAVTAGD